MRSVNRTCAAPFGALADYVEVLAVVAVVTVIGWYLPLDYHAFGYLYLLAVIALSLHVSRWPVLVAAVVSALSWNFVFVPPRLSFSVLHFDDSLLLSCYFVVAVIGTQLTGLRSADGRAKLLAESERMHQTLLDCVSHELKTPISVFRSAVEQLDTDDHDKRTRMLKEIRIAVQRLENLVANLLNQTRLESGMLKPQLDWCDSRDLVAAARRVVGSRMEGHPLTIEIPQDFPIFLADAALMEEAIAHLLLNAAVHTPVPGRVRVTASVSVDTKWIFLAVSDEGPGISAGLRSHIFDKFHRGASTRIGGLGLGLSIVRGFMRAQGGEVSVESPPSGGAQFTLSLPRSASEAVPHA